MVSIPPNANITTANEACEYLLVVGEGIANQQTTWPADVMSLTGLWRLSSQTAVRILRRVWVWSKTLDIVSKILYVWSVKFVLHNRLVREWKMSFEEKSAWVMGLVAAASYSVYIVVILGLAGTRPVMDVAYVAPLLWTVGASIAVSIALHAVLGMSSPQDAGKKDQRDKEIYRFGEYIGQSFVVIGGVSALLMAMAELDYFWIANVIYLAFVLSAILGSVAKIVAYRRGFQPW